MLFETHTLTAAACESEKQTNFSSQLQVSVDIKHRCTWNTKQIQDSLCLTPCLRGGNPDLQQYDIGLGFNR